MLLLAHFLLGVRAYELFDDHEAATDSDNQPSIQHLGENLPGSKHVESVSKSLDGHWATCLIDVVIKQLVQHITLLSSEELGWFPVLTLLNDLFLQPLNLLFAFLTLCLNLGKLCFSR